MLILLRLLFPCLFVFCLLQGAQANRNAASSLEVGSLFYAVLALFMAIGTGMVWASYLGEKIAEPLTNVLTSGETVEGDDAMERLISALQRRRWRRVAVWLCFMETLRHPHAPGMAWAGLKLSKPGTWLEREFAWMVFAFNNAQHCLEAYGVLKRHGIMPPRHSDPMVTLFLQASEQMPKQSNPPVPLAEAAPAGGPRRDPRIQLFEMDTELMSLSVKAREKVVSASNHHAPDSTPSRPGVKSDVKPVVKQRAPTFPGRLIAWLKRT